MFIYFVFLCPSFLCCKKLTRGLSADTLPRHPQAGALSYAGTHHAEMWGWQTGRLGHQGMCTKAVGDERRGRRANCLCAYT